MVKNKKKKGSHQKNKKSSHTNYHTNKNNENNNENNNELSANATSSNRPCLLVGHSSIVNRCSGTATSTTRR